MIIRQIAIGALCRFYETLRKLNKAQLLHEAILTLAVFTFVLLAVEMVRLWVEGS